MKLVINVPDYVKEQADDGKVEELGIPLWLAYEIANGTQLPNGHGRLIDAYDMKNIEFINKGDYNSTRSIREWIDSAPTIIEADNGESEDAE